MSRYSKHTDDQLVQLYADGCNEAFNALLERYDAQVHTHIRYVTADEDLVEDIFQETFIKVMYTIRRGRYQADGKFKAWVMRIAHNLMMDYFRKTKSEARYEPLPEMQEQTDTALRQVACTDLNAEESLLRQDAIAELYEGLERLPAEQRQVVQMRYWEDKSFKEIAEETGVSINTALGRMRYALINLRKQVSPS